MLRHADDIDISRSIENEEERNRIKKMAEKIKPKGMGLIVRTAYESKSTEDLTSDLNFLIKLWEKIKQKERSGPAPRCIHKDISLIYRAVSDLFTWNVDKFIINDRQEYAKVLELVEMASPALKLRVEYFSKSIDLFEYYQIEPKISKHLREK